MTVPSYQEFAELIGLHSGSSTHLIKARTDEQEDRLSVIYNGIVHGDQFDSDQKGVFWSQFNASYLPSFVQTILDSRYGTTGRETFTEEWWDIQFFALDEVMSCVDGGAGPLFARFVRENVEVSIKLARRLVRIMDVPVPRLPSNDHFISRAFKVLQAARYIIQHIVVQNPSVATTPTLLPGFDAGAFPLLLSALGKLARWTSPELGFSEHYTLFKSIQDANLGLAAMRVDLRERSLDPWWSCESKRMKTSLASPCLRLGAGEEMKACGRCRAVRYCCREHQRLDWKRHKKFCLETTW